MLKTASLTRTRVQRFHEDVVKPGIYGATAAVQVGVFQCADPMAYGEAVGQAFVPVEVGFRFGPKWSTAWFHVTGAVPAEMAGEVVVLRFKSETEALVYVGGVPAQGMERNHDDFVLARSAKGGEKVDLFIECGVNTFFGAGGGSRKDSRAPLNSLAPVEKPNTPLPTDRYLRIGGEDVLQGHLKVCEIAVLRPQVRALSWDMEFLRSLEGKLTEKTPRKKQILRALNDAVNALDAGDVAGTAGRAREILAAMIETKAGGSASACWGVGHAHIDTAWLWPLRETKRKCSRTFSTQVALMEEYPEYVFQASQAQLYAFTKENYPGLFAKIKTKVAGGQWDVGGAMWVEADCNIPSGESLVRQILHGTRFWEDAFGKERGKQSYLWLPDVFGYSAALPQILTQAGLDSFVTQKISWSQFNKFPHHTFYWEGIDGTKILSHFLPADNYNASNRPEELIHGMENNQDADRANMFLTAYGYGDGGGGPTREHIEFVRRAKDCDGLPKTRCGRVDDFLAALRGEAKDLETWVGELYLELHRGTYTTQAKNKRANRYSEFLLHDAEFLWMAKLAQGQGAKSDYPAAKLDAAWKTVLLNQFHDIIPGSSITWVYEDSQEQYAQVSETVGGLINEAAGAWAGAIDTAGTQAPFVVFNTHSWEDAGLVEIAADVPAAAVRSAGGRVMGPVQKIEGENGAAYLARVTEVPAMGYGVFDLTSDSPPLIPSETAKGSAGETSVLENRLLRVELDGAGRVTRLFDKLAKREVVEAGRPANQLMLYEDRPNNWAAWDVDAFYLEKGQAIATPACVRLVESGPVRAVLEFSRELGKKSKLVQKVLLAAESMRVDFVTEVEWREDFTFLRVLHPVGVLSNRATYEIQYGHAERPTHFNTSWDFARFEVCAQKWADLAEPGYGVALLNTGKYGHSCHGNVLGLSLLRSPNSPDPTADRGAQKFTYALLPHGGDLRAAAGGPGTSVIGQAYRLNNPLRAVRTSVKGGGLPARFSVMTCDRENVIIETVKKAEGDGRMIVRLYEAHGARGPVNLKVNVPFKKAMAVDLLERPTELYGVKVEGQTIGLEMGPFAIRTVAIEL